METATATRTRAKRKSETFMIPINQIESDESRNSRTIYGDIEGLAESILNSGQQRPVRVKKVSGEERYILKDGFRRMRAIRLLVERGEDFPFVEVSMVPKGYNDDDALLEQIIGNGGLPLSQLEEGNVFKQLINRGYTETDISRKIGKPISHIRACLAVSCLPKEIQNQVSEGVLSGNTAVEIFKSVNEIEADAVRVIKETVAKKKEETGAQVVKIRPKDVSTIKSKSPIKKMQELSAALDGEGIINEKVDLLKKLISRLRADVDLNGLMEIFK